MPTIHCLLIHSGQVLLDRRQDVLRPIREAVNAGESPLEACLRAVRDETGWKVNPSCVALISYVTEGRQLDYSLVFIAETPQAGASPKNSTFEWVDVDQISRREDVSELNRTLMPRILGSGHPIRVVLADDTSKEPPERRLVEIAQIDLARLSPLVFAMEPKSPD